MGKSAVKDIEARGSDVTRSRRQQLVKRLDEHGVGNGMKKPRALIRMVSVKPGEPFTLVDRRVLNLLQERVVADLKAEEAGEREPDPRGFHSMNISTISAITGINDYSEIRSVISRLRTMEVRYDRLEPDYETLFDGDTALFSQEMQCVDDDQVDGVFRFAFPPGIVDMLREPQPYAFINFSNVFSFTSKYSVALYENLALHMHMRNKTWTVSVDSLLDLIGWPRKPGEKVDFSKVRNKAIEFAIREINALGNLSAFSVSAEYNKDVDTFHNRRVASVTFTVESNFENKRKGNSYSSGTAIAIPEGWSTDGALAQKERHAQKVWAAFTELHGDEAVNSRLRWNDFIASYFFLNHKRNLQESGFHISPSVIGEMVDEYHDALGQPSRKATADLLLAIWRLRVIEAKRYSRGAENVSGLDKDIILNATADGRQDLRDGTFKAVLRREAEHQWSYSVPALDGFEKDRLVGQIETTYKPKAHAPSTDVSEAQPRAPEAVSITSMSKKAKEEAEAEAEKLQRDFRAVEAEAERLDVSLYGISRMNRNGLEEARFRIEQHKLKSEIERSTRYKSNIAAVVAADEKEDENHRMPVTAKPIEIIEDEEIPF